MPGGNKEAWPHIKTIFQGIAAKVGTGDPNCDWVGDKGAGCFVKMVHNGMENGDMQWICESYHLMKYVLGRELNEMSQAFGDWNKAMLDSFLIEITVNILRFQDSDSIHPLPKSGTVRGRMACGNGLPSQPWSMVCHHPCWTISLCAMLVISEGQEISS